MVTLAIAAVLATLAVPSFRAAILSSRVNSVADTVASDFRFARSEAVKRTRRVTVCASSDGSTCVGNGGLWRTGWIVFIPTAANGGFTVGDEIIRVQDAFASIDSIAAADGTSRPQFVFEPTGWARVATQTFIITPTGGDAASMRVVCISNLGRAGIRAKGAIACG